MVDEILIAMATDLNIDRFVSESDLQFINRLLYSAMACWIKTAALDRSVSFHNDVDQGVSRRHILERCDGILTKMLQRFPSSKPWFEPEPRNESAVQLLRSRLIRHGDLLNVGFQTNLALAPQSITPITSDTECGRGYTLNPSFFYSGISMLRRRQEADGFEERDREDACEWLRNYIRSAWWESAGRLEDIEYFNPFCNSRSNHGCWQDAVPIPVEGIIFARHLASKLPAEYLFIKFGENERIHRIDRFLRETGEYRRVQFALREMVDNNLIADAKIYKGHIHLKLSFYLPEWENRLFESFAWPYSSISDKLEWDMVSLIWPYIKIHLEKLGIVIREEIVDGQL